MGSTTLGALVGLLIGGRIAQSMPHNSKTFRLRQANVFCRIGGVKQFVAINLSQHPTAHILVGCKTDQGVVTDDCLFIAPDAIIALKDGLEIRGGFGGMKEEKLKFCDIYVLTRERPIRVYAHSSEVMDCIRAATEVKP